MIESKTRSLSKGVFWRITSVFTLAIITYIFTGDLVAVTVITLVANGIFLVLFYINERIWLKLERPTNRVKRSILKMFMYITIMGMPTMFLITYLVTRDVGVMTSITITYVGIKHIMYIFHELLWDKIRWGTAKVTL